MPSISFDNVIFQHLVEFPSFDCVYCSTEEKVSGETRLYLIFNNRRQVYLRNALKGTWDKIKNDEEREVIREGYDVALREKRIPCYST